MNFLTDWGNATATGTPQGCVLGPALFTLFTDCTPTCSSYNTVVKLIADQDEPV